MKASPILASVFIAVATASDAQPLPSPVQLQPCVSVQVEAVPVITSASIPGPFRATVVSDLRFRVLFPAGTKFEGTEILTLKIRTPRGHLYRTLEAPVAASSTPAASEGTRHVSGYPSPLRESVTTESRTAKGTFVSVLSPPFPVGGTTIATASLYGHWSVEAMIESGGNGESRPGSCQAKFRIER